MKKETISSIIRICLSIVILIGIYKETESFWLMFFCITVTIFIELSFWNNKQQREINISFINSMDSLAKGMKSNNETITLLGKAIQKLKEKR